MAKALITSDLHLSSNIRDAYRQKWVSTLPALMNKYKVSELLILGDLTEAKDNHDAELVNFIFQTVHQCAQVAPVYILRGNHDGLTASNSFFRFLDYIKDVWWCERPETATLKSIGPCNFIPHMRSAADWKADQMSSKPVILTHNTFSGADVGHGQIMDGLPLSLLPATTTVISGDVHVPQKLKNVTYVGAPYTVDFGDDYEPRFLLAEKVAGKCVLTSVLCKGPQKRSCVLALAELSNISRHLRDVNSDDILDLQIQVTADEQANLATIITSAQKWAEQKGVVLHSVRFKTDQASKRSIKSSNPIKSAQSDATVLTNYCKRNKVTGALAKAGHNILKK